LYVKKLKEDWTKRKGKRKREKLIKVYYSLTLFWFGFHSLFSEYYTSLHHAFITIHQVRTTNTMANGNDKIALETKNHKAFISKP